MDLSGGSEVRLQTYPLSVVCLRTPSWRQTQHLLRGPHGQDWQCFRFDIGRSVPWTRL